MRHATVRSILVIITSLAMTLTAGCAHRQYACSQATGETMVADTFVARPGGLAATVGGTAVFLVSLPFSLISGSTEDAVQKLIAEPAAYTFTRPLGEDLNWQEPQTVCRQGAAAGGAMTRVFTLKADTLFDFDQTDLKASGKLSLNEVITELNQPDIQSINAIQIVGYTDSVGTQAYNDQLAERRAQTVANYLAQSGVPRNIITAEGRGKCCYIAPNTLPDGQDNPEGRAMNRRVDITVNATSVVSQR